MSPIRCVYIVCLCECLSYASIVLLVSLLFFLECFFFRHCRMLWYVFLISLCLKMPYIKYYHLCEYKYYKANEGKNIHTHTHTQRALNKAKESIRVDVICMETHCDRIERDIHTYEFRMNERGIGWRWRENMVLNKTRRSVCLSIYLSLSNYGNLVIQQDNLLCIVKRFTRQKNKSNM